jgi:hypothetical protein
MTMVTVIIKTVAAILVITVRAEIKMGAAEVLVASRTRGSRLNITDETPRIVGETIR